MASKISQIKILVHFKFWFALGACLVFLVIYLSLTPAPQVPSFRFGDKISHLIAYATLTGWFGQLYTRFNTQVWIFVGFTLLGVSLEFFQGLGGVRVFEYADMVANTLGALLGWWLTRTWFAGAFLRVEQFITNRVTN